jgi:hypothetical protein
VTDRPPAAEPAQHDAEARAARRRAAEFQRDGRLASRAAALLRASALPPSLAARTAAAAAAAAASGGGRGGVMVGLGVRMGRNALGEHVVEWVLPGSAAARKLAVGDAVAGVTEVGCPTPSHHSSAAAVLPIPRSDDDRC